MVDRTPNCHYTPKMIRSIQAYRGFAAMLVVAFHANLIASEYFEQTPITDFFSFGHSGVPFFFVLSGFIIYYIHKADIGKPQRGKPYLYKRIARIYPIYWIVTLAVLPAYFLVPSFGSPYHREFVALVKSLILIPQDHSPHLAVAWTLCHEMFFYLMFALLIYKKRLGQGLFAFWMLMTLGAVLMTNFSEVILEFPSTFVFSPYNLLFGFGLLAGWLNDKSWKLLSAIRFPSFLLGNVLFVATGCMENYWTGTNDGSIMLFGLAAFLLVLSASDQRVEKLFASNKLLQLLGNASYSVYLTHFLTMSMLGKVIGRFELLGELPNVINWGLLCISAAVVGTVLYRYVERPLLASARRHISL